jgi:hypothetical protein
VIAESRLRPRPLVCVALAMGCVYLWWNVAWLRLGSRAPALSLALFDIPAPTTGGSRALRALLEGRVVDSLAWNPMALPIVLLLLMSIGVLAHRLARRDRIVLPRRIAWAWLVTLALAWGAKLIAGPRYW